jgi:NADH-quinone oxidoreductase subunit N
VVRLLAYSSIAQAGYILLPFALATPHGTAVNQEAFAAVTLYILIYAVMNLGAFGVVVALSKEAPGLLISDFAGLGVRAPLLAGAMTMFLVSLGGIPPFAGFWGKFYIFKAAIDSGSGVGAWLAIAMVVNSVISIVYYFAIARAMWLEPVTEPVRPLRLSSLVGAVVVLAAAGVVVVGILPELFAHFPQVSTLVGP